MGVKSIISTGLMAGLLGVTIAAQTAQAEGVSRAALLAAQCNACHGTDGGGAKPMPNIAGEEVADFVELMQAFASGEEDNTVMERHMAGYTEEEIKELAKYFSER